MNFHRVCCSLAGMALAWGCLTGWLDSPVLAGAGDQDSAGQKIRVACVGDSITAGARVEVETESYPAQLQSLLGPDYEVRNFGLGGATLIKTGRPNVWQRLDAVLEFAPQVVVISLGTNDTVGGSRQNWEQIDRFEADYRELLEKLHQLPTTPQILVCTPTAMELQTPGLNESRVADLRERQPRLLSLCQKVRKLVEDSPLPQVSLLELHGVLQGHPEWLTPGDGVHPNARGYRALARAVARRLRPAAVAPNVVFFLVDDMGWQDTSVPFHTEVTEFNRRYQTPHMERLASAGMKFTQAYACSVCSPSRISLMTGWNAARHRVTNWTLRKDATNDRPHPRLEFPQWNVNGLSPVPGIPRTVCAPSLPGLLQQAGYRTIHVGKAHFGAEGTPASDPRAIGFDVNIAGHAAGGPGSFLGTQNFSAAWRQGDRIWDVPGLEPYHGQDIFLTEALTREANHQVDLAVEAGQPFFLYLAHYAVHVPFAEDQRYYQAYRDRGLDPTEAMYAAMVEGMDRSLGDVLDNLARHQIEDETLVVFFSDNGGLSAHGRGGQPHTHNRPLSSGKGSAHEGGVRVPLLVSWPGVTAPGSQCDQPTIVEDWFPTLLEVAGLDLAARAPAGVDGVSLVPWLEAPQRQSAQPRPLVWHFPNHWGPQGPGIGASSALRLGPWKLIYYHDDERYELFDLSQDLGEQQNLAAARPEVRDRLANQLGSYLRSVAAQMPIRKPTGQPVPYPGSRPDNP